MATVNDVVLLYLEDTPVSFARIESILPDAKKDWYHIRLLMLQIPMQVVSWILKNDYINGHEFFMNGKKMRLEKVESPVEDFPISAPAPRDRKKTKKKPDPEEKKQGRIISFSDFKKNHEPEPG
jgi:hypothetical protein